MKIEKVVVIGNILRYKDGLAYDTKWVYFLFKYLIGSISNIQIEYKHDDKTTAFYKSLYSILGYEHVTDETWIEIYNANNNEKTLNLIKKEFDQSLVIAFELHPFLQQAFDLLGIPYIKTLVHPIRYMDDVFLAFTSSEKIIFDRFEKNKIDVHNYYQAASFIQAETAVLEFINQINIKPNSAVFFGQTDMDSALLENNHLHSFFEYKERFLDIVNQYDHVYYKVHPYKKNAKVLAFMRKIKKVTILYPHEINMYDLLSSDNIKKCFSISSGALYEAKFFNKEIEYFYKQPYMFVNDYLNNDFKDYKEIYIPIFKDNWQPSFWAKILENYIPINKEIPQDNNEIFSNKIRRILKMRWGYKDNSSVYVDDAVRDIYSKLYDNKFFLARSPLYRFIVRCIVGIIPSSSLRKKIRNKLI